MTDNQRIDLDEIRALIAIAAEAEIAELEVESPRVKVRIKKAFRLSADGVPAGGPPPAETQAPQPAAGTASPGADARYAPIVSPMVGTFYRAPKPDAAPFVQEGDRIEVGQVVCVLEAMKMFNEIQSDVAGRVASALVENGAPVEYGQPLFLIDPSHA